MLCRISFLYARYYKQLKKITSNLNRLIQNYSLYREITEHFNYFCFHLNRNKITVLIHIMSLYVMKLFELHSEYSDNFDTTLTPVSLKPYYRLSLNIYLYTPYTTISFFFTLHSLSSSPFSHFSRCISLNINMEQLNVIIILLFGILGCKESLESRLTLLLTRWRWT